MNTLIYRYTTRKGHQYEKHIEIEDDEDGVVKSFEKSPRRGVRLLKKLLPKRSQLDFVAMIPFEVETADAFPRFRLKGKLFNEC